MKTLISVLIGSLIFVACTGKKQASKESTSGKSAEVSNELSTVVQLGKHLYFDKRLSMDNSVSCNSCHDITGKKGGVDNLPTSVGINGQKGGRNAPTVWNARFLTTQFWDGRAKDLVEQAKGPITNPIEMGMPDHDAAVEKIKQVKGYKELFKKAFPGQKNPINIDNLATAIAKFEETLTTTNSPFDKFKAGDKAAMTADAQQGWEKFQTVGCTSCHSGDHFAGPTKPVGSGHFMKFPMMPGSRFDAKYELSKDLGRFESTKNENDKHLWRVPTLRNIALTGPYFHNGKVTELSEAVRVMAKTQLGKDLKDGDVKEIVAFLKSLTGDLPEITAPASL